MQLLLCMANQQNLSFLAFFATSNILFENSFHPLRVKCNLHELFLPYLEIPDHMSHVYIDWWKAENITTANS